jgi:hypothetical protein
MNLRHTLSHGSGAGIVAALEAAAEQTEYETAHAAGVMAARARQDLYVQFRDAAAARGEYDLGRGPGGQYLNPFGYKPTLDEEQQMGAAAEEAASRPPVPTC